MKTKLIVILSALVLVLSGFMLYDSLNNEMSQAEIQTQFNDLKSDYEYIQKDLEIAVNDSNFNNKEILIQKQRIEKLISKNNVTQEELNEAKSIMRKISRDFIKNYKGKVVVLKDENQKLLSENEQTIVELTQLKGEVEDLSSTIAKEKIISSKKDELISYASKLSLSNFILKGFKVRESGKEIETDKASRIDRIKVYFDVNENMIADSGEKTIYTVIKKPTGETVTFGNKPNEFFVYNKNKILASDKLTFNFDKDKMQTLEFVWDSEDFGRGDYIMEIYEQTKKDIVQIGKATKSLK